MLRIEVRANNAEGRGDAVKAIRNACPDIDNQLSISDSYGVNYWDFKITVKSGEYKKIMEAWNSNPTFAITVLHDDESPEIVQSKTQVEKQEQKQAQVQYQEQEQDEFENDHTNSISGLLANNQVMIEPAWFDPHWNNQHYSVKSSSDEVEIGQVIVMIGSNQFRIISSYGEREDCTSLYDAVSAIIRARDEYKNNTKWLYRVVPSGTQYIWAIRAVREITGMSLVDAKDVVSPQIKYRTVKLTEKEYLTLGHALKPFGYMLENGQP